MNRRDFIRGSLLVGGSAGLTGAALAEQPKEQNRPVVFVQYLEQAARELPAEKLIFGSDGPLVDLRVELHKIRLLKLPGEKEDLILGGNILRLLGR